MDIRLKISPPWITYINKLSALFDGDPQIAFNVDLSSASPAVILSCNNGDKVNALRQVLPEEVDFGNVTLTIDIDGIPSNRVFTNKEELFDTLFAKNPVYAYSVSPEDDGYEWFSMVYVVFKNRVVQFFNDNLNDCHGIVSTLYQDIATEILTGDAVAGVYFNTDVEVGKVGAPLGEWP